MKKLIILISICTFIACHKADLQPPSDPSVFQEDIEEYDDSDSEENEPLQLETRGAGFLISSFEPLSTSDVVPSNAPRFASYGLLNNLGGTDYKIIGTGFGATKGTSTIQLKYKTVINNQMPVISWSNTVIVINVSKSNSIVAPILKNLSLKVVIERDSTLNGVTRKVFTSKSRKVTGLYKDYYSYNSCFTASEVAYYPTSLWQVAWEQYTRPSGSSTYSARQSIDTYYVPRATDVLMRGSNATQYAIVQSVTGPATGANAGRYTVKVNERNYAGNGMIQRKVLYYKKSTGFNIFRNEPQFTYYSVESGG